MSLRTMGHYNAYRYTKIYHASRFETALMELLAVSDYHNTELILKNWGSIVDRLAENYELGEAKARRREKEMEVKHE